MVGYHLAEPEGLRVLCVDDEEARLHSLKLLLEDEFSHVHVDLASVPSAAVEKLRRERYDLLLIASTMRNMTGFELVQLLRTGEVLDEDHVKSVPVLLLAADARRVKEDAITRVLGRTYGPKELLAAMYGLLGKTPAGDELLAIRTPDFVLRPYDNTVTVTRDGRVVRLTAIEARLLRCLAMAPNRTLTRDSLVIKVWGYEYESGGDQLIVYFLRLKHKIEENPSRPKLFLVVPGVGYRYQPSDLEAGAEQR